MVFTSLYILRFCSHNNISRSNYTLTDTSQVKKLKSNGGIMRPDYCSLKGSNGFTLIEALKRIGTMAFRLAITIPGISIFFPGCRLKSAARDMYSAHMQSAKMKAVRSNSDCTIVFDVPTSKIKKTNVTKRERPMPDSSNLTGLINMFVFMNLIVNGLREK